MFFTPLSQALRLIVHLGEPLPEVRQDIYGFSFGTLFVFFLASYGFMICTNGVGASTGMFVPALAVGATGGRIMGQIVRLVVRALGSDLPVSLTSYSVIGAAAYMGGATRMTLTTTVMVMETTGSLQLIVPLMITVFFAKVSIRLCMLHSLFLVPCQAVWRHCCMDLPGVSVYVRSDVKTS